VDRGACVDAAPLGGPRALGPPLRQASEIEIRIGGDDRRAARGGGVAERRRDDDARGLRRRQLLRILGIGEKRDRRRRRRLERIDGVDPRLGIADQFAAEPLDDVAKLDFAHRAASYLPPLCALSALITLSVMSTFGLQKTASCRMRSYFSASKICLMTRFVRSTTVASSSFLRWLRSSWNSRRRRCRSRSWSTSSRWRRVRSASPRVGASLSRRSLAALSLLASSLRSFSRFENSASSLACAAFAGNASRSTRSLLT